METRTDIAKIEAYCHAAGISPSTLGVRVLGNSRFFDRLGRRIKKTESDLAKVLAYMAANPVTPEGKQ